MCLAFKYNKNRQKTVIRTNARVAQGCFFNQTWGEKNKTQTSHVALPRLSALECGLRKCLSTPEADDFNKYALRTILSS